MDGAASRFGIDGRGLGEVDRHLGSLELVAFLDDRPGFRKLSAQLVRARIGAGRRLAPAVYCSADGTPFITGDTRASNALVSTCLPVESVMT